MQYRSPAVAIAEVCDGMPAWWPRKLTKGEFHAAIRAKGLTLSDVAFIWGISIAAASRIAADFHRAEHWLYALDALPSLTRAQIKQLREARKLLWPYSPPPPKPLNVMSPAEAQADDGYRMRGLVDLYESVACHATCGIAEEGDAAGYIADIRDTGHGEEYLVWFSTGEDWFPPADFDDYFYTTGRVLDEAERAQLIRRHA